MLTGFVPDQAALLSRLQSLGLEVVEVCRVPDLPALHPGGSR